jgi:esterase/lipase superfamily enzyme
MNLKRIFWIFVVLALLYGCVSNKIDIRDRGITEPNYSIVKTFFATDRNLTEDKKPDKMFGVSRSKISYGSCEVSIPYNHQIGELESPSILRFEFSENPNKHVTLLKIDVSSKEQFFTDVIARISGFEKSSAFLFVHGYNTTFEDAARRTAQITFDLKFQGAPVFYSWPSQGKTTAYTVDEQNVEWTTTNLKNFLDDFLTRSDAQNVYLIAHSMGNRALTRATVSLLDEKPDLKNRLTEVILTAPDIDADVFKRDIAPALSAAARSITLYASSEDKALMASKKVHGYPRAGDSGEKLIIFPGIETIDATGLDTSFLGHTYFAETRSAISDLYNLIQFGQRADNRSGLCGIDTQAGRHWKFKR